MQPGDIIKYVEMTMAEQCNLQRGMNFRIKPKYTIVLMSVRKGSPYSDRVEDDGETIIYEGHDVQKNYLADGEYPKEVDQPIYTPSGRLTQNGMFYEAAQRHKNQGTSPELVKVYDKIKDGIWVFNGYFHLVDAWQETDRNRKVFKFKLVTIDYDDAEVHQNVQADITGEELVHARFIPSSVKADVWKRDKGQCVQCGSIENLHFDHILPFSRGGTSLSADNIQLLCMKHNLKKSNKI